MIGRLAFGLGLFVGSLLTGWFLGRVGLLTDVRAKRVIRVVLKWLSPVVLCLSFWRLSMTGMGPWLLPVIGCLLACCALVPAWGYARAAHLNQSQTGSFLTCAMFSNVGFLGAFVAFALYGELGYGLGMWYLVFFNPCFYLVGFGLAKRFGSRTQAADDVGDAFSDELRLYPFLGLCLGLGLGLAKVPRPASYEFINHLLIPVETVCYLAAIGSQVTYEPLRRWLTPCLAMSAIKFWYTPALGWILVSCFHLTGLPRAIVLLQSAMPVAISPLMLPLLFGLDRKLSVALWISTTLLAIPWLLIYLSLIH
ncbi:MAG: AEC family transporter [Candidatus Omnitrophica bacterium]|nr:AEC family transporter [Candidatus Omnitrophota bacterium]